MNQATVRRTLVSLALLTAAPSAFGQEKDWYKNMQIGPAWSDTFAGTLGGKEGPVAVKGILVDIGEGNRVLFDTETLRVVSAYHGDIKWGGTPWTGEHGKLIAIDNGGDKALVSIPAGPGWADASGNFTDKRDKELHGWGNLEHAKYKGFFRDGKKIIFSYEVLGTPVYESYESIPNGIVRQFQVAAHKQALSFAVAGADDALTVSADKAGLKSGASVAIGGKGPSLAKDGGLVVARLSASSAPITFTVAYTKGEAAAPAPVDLAALTKGGDPLWGKEIKVAGNVSTDTKAPWVTDTIPVPSDNPWKASIRFSGFDFIDEDTAAVCTWNGDVWTVSGLKGDWSSLTWKRFASGLFEPLGLKVVDGSVYVHGRDQITKLTDLNKDGEADRYDAFFRDEAVSPNFHEFGFELQTDKQGNFYTCKASPVRGGGRGFDTIYPSHGTVLQISADGTKSRVIATGLRAPGGLAVGPNGEITTGENEGTWQPCCKLNYFTPKDFKDGPVFLGTEPSKHDAKKDLHEPLCYFPMSVDNSGGSQVWVPEGVDFGLKPGELIHGSYGQSSLFRVLPDPVDGVMQGGVVKLPITLGASAMRERFHKDGSMYVCGLRGWQTNAANETAFQRIRYNKGVAVPLPNKVEFTKTGVRISFEKSISADLAKDPASYNAERWNYVRGPQYGSGEFSVDNVDQDAEKRALDKESHDYKKHDAIKITAARPSKDGKSVELDFEGHKPSMTLKVAWDLEDSAGEVVKGEYYGTYRKAGK
ncbi:DUF6797 domain-containing protein [Haloferula sp. BvORR071]|uniref:DUF6797 domain-containing protein n=1 Tax=Haloferula sp. BvORR071 TaxID=1396141 RepID=UPI000695F971|nr:DUF6797 domain-containing protein [Haloferula sp. BvORR071]